MVNLAIYRRFEVLFSNKFYVVGSFFLIFQIFVLYQYIFLARFDNMLWFCSHTPLLFGVGFFLNNKSLIKSLISVGFLIQLFWIVDFLGMLIFGFFIFGATEYMFQDMHILAYIISIIEHFLSAPLALLLVYKYKTSKKVFVYSFFYLLIILILSLSFAPAEYNYNFVHFIPIFGNVSFIGYHYAWIFLAMIFIVLPTYYFQVFLYKIYRLNFVKRKKF